MMRRAGLLLSLITALCLAPSLARAQDGEPEIEMEPEGGEPPDGPEGDPGTATDPSVEIDMSAEGEAAAKNDVKLGETRASWADIVVVIRKPFLKMNRVELTPSAAVTLNDNMIRHYELNGQLSYWLTDVLAVGFEGQFFVKDFLETYDLVARQDRRLPTLNKYNFGAALNFHYVPVYAKFAMFNRSIVHWEAFFTAGVGFTQSEVIPRDPQYPSWTNFLITPNVGFTMRVFLTQWVTLNLGVRDYVFIDQFENVRRGADPLDQGCARDVQCSMDEASGKLVNHVVFQAGLSFWFPTSFKYTTFR